MELELGGPVWHASARAATVRESERLALLALNGAGDARLGEWREVGQRAFHVRRRLSDDERFLAGGLVVRDIRGSDEERRRQRTLLDEAPQLAAYFGAVA